ncbi:MAG TPA: L-rhamnose mutarotase [Parvibaculum sp.]|mgnify:CR=1 FL=1|uniref:L-rhamnose mutarotase n=1 Tax=Parvibaculum sp. TaxID=2024848 RepID=UPI002B526823|nr:L-rhamnose mutarotase [Parvibaculum sp.]HMM13387.1 L-rhamnose mutarotase [Parvibaculum sp.]
MQRMGMVIGVRPEKIAEYKRLHAAVWPEVLDMISACNIRNYTIFLREPENLLFSCWDYVGTDFEADMARMRAHEPTQRWWELTDPCQQPLASREAGEHWARMEEVFHAD